MPRLARVKVESGAYYHLYARTAGEKNAYPLNNKVCRRKLVETIERFSRVFCCRVIAFCVMGNHYHLLVEMDAPFEIDRKELRRRAELLYEKQVLDAWFNCHWDRFAERIFDVSELMRSVQAAFARWYNQKHDRRGAFWAGRFKSTLLEDTKPARECACYIELNPIRAGLVERPEEYEGSSLFFRELGKDNWMMPLTDFLFRKSRKVALREYKARIYYRGIEPTKHGQVRIPKWLAKEEERRNFAGRGLFQKRLRYFVNGVVLGSKGFVADHLAHLVDQGQYKRRKHPIEHEDMAWFALRPQRQDAG